MPQRRGIAEPGILALLLGDPLVPSPDVHIQEIYAMTEEQLKKRLAERKICEAEHAALMVPHNGFGWIGSRCPQCGFMFFGEWEPWVLRTHA